MFCDACISYITRNKLDVLDLEILRVFIDLEAFTLSTARPINEITQNIVKIKATTALVNKSLLKLNLFELLITVSGKPQKYYVSDSGKIAFGIGTIQNIDNVKVQRDEVKQEVVEKSLEFKNSLNNMLKIKMKD